MGPVKLVDIGTMLHCISAQYFLPIFRPIRKKVAVPNVLPTLATTLDLHMFRHGTNVQPTSRESRGNVLLILFFLFDLSQILLLGVFYFSALTLSALITESIDVNSSAVEK